MPTQKEGSKEKNLWTRPVIKVIQLNEEKSNQNSMGESKRSV